MDVTLITCTGDRHYCFQLLERHMKAQTFIGDVQWIVVDDGETPTHCTLGQTVLKIPTLDEGASVHPMPRKIQYVLDAGLIDSGKILFIEDDDYYGPDYVQVYADMLDDHPIVGEGMARYYHVRDKLHWRHHNLQHASLAQTGLRTEHLDWLVNAIDEKGDPFIDLRLWRNAKGAGYIFTDPQDKLAMFCGLKAMPGRGGVACGHDAKRQGYQKDAGMEVLKRWTRDSWNEYAVIK